MRLVLASKQVRAPTPRLPTISRNHPVSGDGGHTSVLRGVAGSFGPLLQEYAERVFPYVRSAGGSLVLSFKHLVQSSDAVRAPAEVLHIALPVRFDPAQAQRFVRLVADL